MKEKDLFPPLKKHFKDLGYMVYAEVPSNFRGVDFVAVKGNEQIAVEMKLTFNNIVYYQATTNHYHFGKSYIAFPRKELLLIDNCNEYWKLSEKMRLIIEWCLISGIGILQIIPPHNIIVEVLEGRYKKPYEIYDFSQYKENDNDEAGLPYQKGVSAGYYELKLIKEYIRNNPDASWKEIYNNVQNHYSSPQSLSGSMSQWRGFSLIEFKKSL